MSSLIVVPTDLMNLQLAATAATFAAKVGGDAISDASQTSINNSQEFCVLNDW